VSDILVCNLVVDASQIANVEHSEINLTDFALFADVVLGLGHVGAETVPEPEVNITTTPQSSESELDETSSLDNNSDEENSSLPPIQTQDLHKANVYYHSFKHIHITYFTIFQQTIKKN
jgi:hypothetical protein